MHELTLLGLNSMGVYRQGETGPEISIGKLAQVLSRFCPATKPKKIVVGIIFKKIEGLLLLLFLRFSMVLFSGLPSLHFPT